MRSQAEPLRISFCLLKPSLMDQYIAYVVCNVLALRNPVKPACVFLSLPQEGMYICRFGPYAKTDSQGHLLSQHIHDAYVEAAAAVLRCQHAHSFAWL